MNLFERGKSNLPMLFLAIFMISGIQAKENNDNNSCSLYLAPSTIRGAGYGIFTTEDVEEMTQFVSSLLVPLRKEHLIELQTFFIYLFFLQVLHFQTLNYAIQPSLVTV